MKVLIRVLQVLFAFVFIFSGVVKCIDPTGTSLKFNEYLLYFGLDFLVDFTMGLSWVLSILEFFVGFNLLMGRALKATLFIAVCMMLLFTPLTLWLACTNAIQDCGCFGDAYHLTNWETFWKNVVLDILLVLFIWRRKDLYNLVGKTNFTFYAYWCLGVMIWLCWLGTMRDPWIDFRPFLPGINIAESVLGDQEGTSDADDEVSYVCVYKRGDEIVQFSLDSLPDESDGWEFVETLELGAHAEGEVRSNETPMLDFFARTEEGELFTEQLLTASGYTILLLSPSLGEASQHDIDRIEQLYEYAQDNQYAFYCLTSRNNDQLEEWKNNTGAEYEFLFTDMQIVETITRANPGVLLLHDGVLCWKENLTTLDVNTIITDKLDKQSYGEIHEIDYQKHFLALLILLFGPLPLSLCFEIPKFYKIITKKQSKNA